MLKSPPSVSGPPCDCASRASRSYSCDAARDRRADFVRRVRIRRAQPRLMHFHVPLEVGILVHLVGPRRSFQFQAADDGDHFLPVRHAQPRLHRRHGNRFRRHKIFLGQHRPAAGAGFSRAQRCVGRRLALANRSAACRASRCLRDESWFVLPCAARPGACPSMLAALLAPAVSAPHSGQTYTSSPSFTSRAPISVSG